MKLIKKTSLALKATRELGVEQTFWYAVYRLGLGSGRYQRATPLRPYEKLTCHIHAPFQLPDSEQLKRLMAGRAEELLIEADEITAGQVRLFGGPPVQLRLTPPDSRSHWTYYEGQPSTWGVEDVKFLWEPARFGWVYPLGRAFILTDDERYPTSFWEHLETFLHSNPPNQGPNWMSGQEVALRLLALLFAARVFERAAASTDQRLEKLSGAVAAHAQRIPATISYALAQNNNHLISEALGLLAACTALPDHPQASRWGKIGWRWFNHALQSQIQPDGTYSQHSMNYHRLMLQAALQGTLSGRAFPKLTLERLAAATNWLLAQVDPVSGRAPNLGSNDGALILPLAATDFTDFRPVAQAASRAFAGRAAFPAGPWDELGLWLGQDIQQEVSTAQFPTSPAVHRLGNAETWATIRAVRFRGRPSHADQLHVDLWWQGENLALDPGTYRYTSRSKWDNELAKTRYHNTVEINGQDQMVRAGRFLWLEWAQAQLLDTSSFQSKTIAAQHHGYQRLGVIHRRVLKWAEPNHWNVTDHLLPSTALKPDDLQTPLYVFRLHWMLPDWPWSIENNCLTLQHPAGGKVLLTLSHLLPNHPAVKIGKLSLVRAGKPLYGPKKVFNTLGWYSPTYGYKIPALSFRLRVQSPLPLTLHSDWKLEK